MNARGFRVRRGEAQMTITGRQVRATDADFEGGNRHLRGLSL
jgi:hypothetical protein